MFDKTNQHAVYSKGIGWHWCQFDKTITIQVLVDYWTFSKYTVEPHLSGHLCSQVDCLYKWISRLVKSLYSYVTWSSNRCLDQCIFRISGVQISEASLYMYIQWIYFSSKCKFLQSKLPCYNSLPSQLVWLQKPNVQDVDHLLIGCHDGTLHLSAICLDNGSLKASLCLHDDADLIPVSCLVVQEIEKVCIPIVIQEMLEVRC